MILLGSEIRKRIGTDIIIKPFKEEQLNPNSYNVTLNEKLLVYDTYEKIHFDGEVSANMNGETVKMVPYDDIKKIRTFGVLDMKKKNATREIIIPEDGYILQPGTLYIGRTNEYTETHNLIPVLDGRSSIGRLGMFIHVTAGYGDNHFKGYWTLEITCVQPIIVYPNVPVGQLRYHTVLGEDTIKYNGKYQNNTCAQPSQLYKDFEK